MQLVITTPLACHDKAAMKHSMQKAGGLFGNVLLILPFGKDRNNTKTSHWLLG